ncbi:MAG: hypothetical protein ACI8QD_002160 [Cyclobacteriaceae bacterium]|jgi:hypothetical protein
MKHSSRFIPLLLFVLFSCDPPKSSTNTEAENVSATAKKQEIAATQPQPTDASLATTDNNPLAEFLGNWQMNGDNSITLGITSLNGVMVRYVNGQKEARTYRLGYDKISRRLKGGLPQSENKMEIYGLEEGFIGLNITSPDPSEVVENKMLVRIKWVDNFSGEWKIEGLNETISVDLSTSDSWSEFFDAQVYTAKFQGFTNFREHSVCNCAAAENVEIGLSPLPDSKSMIGNYYGENNVMLKLNNQNELSLTINKVEDQMFHAEKIVFNEIIDWTFSSTTPRQMQVDENVQVNQEVEQELFTVNAQFVEFFLGDASHYIFKDIDERIWDFGRCESCDFAKELDEAEVNMENQGWGSNASLQGSWFGLSYAVKQLPLYQDGPIGDVFVIVGFSEIEDQGTPKIEPGEIMEITEVTNNDYSPEPFRTFLHAPGGDFSKAHGDIIVNYVSWDGQNWTAKLKGNTFVHAKNGDFSTSHQDEIINYVFSDGSQWTAKVSGNTFTHARNGDFSTSHQDVLLGYVTWGGGSRVMKIKE